MALMRRERSPLWSDPFERDVFEWPIRSFGALRRMVEEDDIKVEEFTEDGQVVIRAELPGVDPEKDVDVSITDGKLCIRAERRHEEKSEGRDYRRTEIRYGSFSRMLPLPPNTKEDDIKATYRDGILEVRAPIDTDEAKASKIPINRG